MCTRVWEVDLYNTQRRQNTHWIQHHWNIAGNTLVYNLCSWLCGIKHKQMWDRFFWCNISLITFHTYRFRFPAIFLVYSAVTLLIYGFFNFATKFDRETVICSSRNLVETLDKGGTSFYCLFVGMTVIIAHIVFINNVFLQGHSLYMQEYRLFSGGFPIPQF